MKKIGYASPFENANDILAWSGVPYFLTQAAKGFITHPLDLREPHYRLKRFLWGAARILMLKEPRGFQYSRCANRMQWKKVPKELYGGEIISHMQTFPMEEHSRHVDITFYTDATLLQLWGKKKAELDPWQKEVFERERAAYLAAKRCIVGIKWVRQSLVDDYGVPPDKIYVVYAGINIQADLFENFLQKRGVSWRMQTPCVFSERFPAHFGFVGRDYQRKGLLRLFPALKILQSRGFPVRLDIIGTCPPEIQADPMVEYHGFIHKGNEFNRYFSLLDTFAMGCMPSYSEPGGMAFLECMSLNVPVMGGDVGGTSEIITSASGILVRRTDEPDDIANKLEKTVFVPHIYRQMCADAELRARDFSWENTISQLKVIMGG